MRAATGAALQRARPRGVAVLRRPRPGWRIRRRRRSRRRARALRASAGLGLGAVADMTGVAPRRPCARPAIATCAPGWRSLSPTRTATASSTRCAAPSDGRTRHFRVRAVAQAPSPRAECRLMLRMPPRASRGARGTRCPGAIRRLSIPTASCLHALRTRRERRPRHPQTEFVAAMTHLQVRGLVLRTARRTRLRVSGQPLAGEACLPFQRLTCCRRCMRTSPLTNKTRQRAPTSWTRTRTKTARMHATVCATP